MLFSLPSTYQALALELLASDLLRMPNNRCSALLTAYQPSQRNDVPRIPLPFKMAFWIVL